MRPVRNTFAVNLLIEAKTVLVVGGGRVGLRKTQSLLEAGAHVKLVCPTALPEFATLPIEHLARPFEAADVMGCALVIACTDSKIVNRAILEAARQAQVPCCCADGNWAEGDFIVPATLRTDDLLISISTNGRSCRTAKEVKDALTRRLTQCSPGVLFIHGIDTACPLPPAELLSERLSFLSGLYGWCFLTTCNRTEIIAWAAPELIRSGLLTHAFHLPASAYTYHGEAAMRHLSYVLAGLKARMIGEFHIVGQVRDAVDAALSAGWANGQLQRAYAEALQRAQTLRAAIAPYIPQVEVEALALEGATGRVVIAGTGSLGRAALAKAREMGLEVTLLYHRHPIEGVDCRPLDQWQSAVQGATRFISALTVTEPLFDANALGIPAYDLGAPRNITGDEVNDLDVLRGDYLARTGAIDTILAIAEHTYTEITRD